MRRERGVTLMELLVVMAIAAILMGMLIVTIMPLRRARTVEAAASKVHAVLLQAKSLAIRNNAPYQVRFDNRDEYNNWMMIVGPSRNNTTGRVSAAQVGQIDWDIVTGQSTGALYSDGIYSTMYNARADYVDDQGMIYMRFSSTSAGSIYNADTYDAADKVGELSGSGATFTVDWDAEPTNGGEIVLSTTPSSGNTLVLQLPQRYPLDEDGLAIFSALSYSMGGVEWYDRKDSDSVIEPGMADGVFGNFRIVFGPDERAVFYPPENAAGKAERYWTGTGDAAWGTTVYAADGDTQVIAITGGGSQEGRKAIRIDGFSGNVEVVYDAGVDTP